MPPVVMAFFYAWKIKQMLKRLYTRQMSRLGIMLALLTITALLGMGTGACRIPATQVMKTISSHLLSIPPLSDIPAIQHTVVWGIRLPRTLLTILVGICLSTSGAVFQGCFKNPLVEPYILGISSGAAFGAALGIVFPSFFLSVQIMAFIFALVAVGAAWAMAKTDRDTPVVTLVLAGIITGSVFTALVGIIKYMAQDQALREIVFWLMGGFYYAGWRDVALLMPVALGGFFAIWISAWKINILSMGDQEAKSLGVDPEKNKAWLIGLATLMTASAVSAVGIIAWVGLMIPHASRMVTGPDHRKMIPVCALLGAFYLVVCDTLARNLAQAEIPIGIITSIVGAPYLFFLVRTRGQQAFGE